MDDTPMHPEEAKSGHELSKSQKRRNKKKQKAIEKDQIKTNNVFQ